MLLFIKDPNFKIRAKPPTV